MKHGRVKSDLRMLASTCSICRTQCFRYAIRYSYGKDERGSDDLSLWISPEGRAEPARMIEAMLRTQMMRMMHCQAGADASADASARACWWHAEPDEEGGVEVPIWPAEEYHAGLAEAAATAPPMLDAAVTSVAAQVPPCPPCVLLPAGAPQLAASSYGGSGATQQQGDHNAARCLAQHAQQQQQQQQQQPSEGPPAWVPVSETQLLAGPALAPWAATGPGAPAHGRGPPHPTGTCLLYTSRRG